MKDYWLVIDPYSKAIEICFPDRKKNRFNACLATIGRKEMEHILDTLKEVRPSQKPARLSFEYFTMDIHYFSVRFSFFMFDPAINYFLYTSVMVDALAEYLDEFAKL